MMDDCNREAERELILMARLNDAEGGTHPELDDLLTFVYDRLFGDGYSGEDSSVLIPNYRKYLRELKSRVSAAAGTNARFGPIALAKPIRNLLFRAKKQLRKEIAL
jgi:hypothetical protein